MTDDKPRSLITYPSRTMRFVPDIEPDAKPACLVDHMQNGDIVVHIRSDGTTKASEVERAFEAARP
jgi:hypothetical protein